MKLILLFTLAVFLPSSYLLSQSLQDSVTVASWNPPNDLRSKLSKEGSIIFKGGVVIEPRNGTGYWNRKQFGGLSSLWVRNGGISFISISDYGSNAELEYRSKWYEFALEFDTDNNLKGVELVKQGQMRGTNGERIEKGAIESIASFNDSIVVISFDGSDTLVAYDMRKDGFNKALKKTRVDVGNFPNMDNGGIEALTETDGGSLLAIYEFRKENKLYNGAWILGQHFGTPRKLQYFSFPDREVSTEDELAVKGATTLSNGDIVLIEKIFRKPNGIVENDLRLVLLKSDNLKNKEIKPITLLKTGFSKDLDNFEGIGSYTANGKEYLLLISDDNGDWEEDTGQNTLIFQFELTIK